MNDRERELREAAELGQKIRELIGQPESDPRYFDREGKVIPDDDLLCAHTKWDLLFCDSKYHIVRETCTAFAELIVTVWLGVEHGWREGKPLIFETTLYKPQGSNDEEFHMFDATEAGAEAGHEWLRVVCLDPPESRRWSRPDLGHVEEV